MPKEVIMPALGMAQDTGKLLGWLKQEGDQVDKGEPLFEVETDKVTVEIEASASGMLVALAAQAGDDVPVGRVIAYLVQPGEDIPEVPSAPTATLVDEAPASPQPTNDNDNDSVNSRIKVSASPVAMRMAAVHDVDLSLVDVGGRRIMKADIERFLEEGHQAADTPASNVLIPIPNTMAAQWRGTPHITLRRDVSVEAALDWCKAANIDLIDVILTACAGALREHRQANAYWDDGSIYVYDEIHIGYAVGAETLILAHADQMTPTALADERLRLLDALEIGVWDANDFPQSTFTVGDLDVVDNFNAIILAPQAAYLSVGRIVKRVVPSNMGPVVQQTVTLSLTADHRILDGARTADLLNQIVDTIYQPLSLLG